MTAYILGAILNLCLCAAIALWACQKGNGFTLYVLFGVLFTPIAEFILVSVLTPKDKYALGKMCLATVIAIILPICTYQIIDNMPSEYGSKDLACAAAVIYSPIEAPSAIPEVVRGNIEGSKGELYGVNPYSRSFYPASMSSTFLAMSRDRDLYGKLTGGEVGHFLMGLFSAFTSLFVRNFYDNDFYPYSYFRYTPPNSEVIVLTIALILLFIILLMKCIYNDDRLKSTTKNNPLQAMPVSPQNGKCDMCDEENVTLHYVKIEDDTGTRLCYVCGNCFAQYNCIPVSPPDISAEDPSEN